MLHEFIAVNRDEIIRRCRAKVATRSIPPPTEAEIDHGVPVFLDQLRDALRLGQITSPEISRSAIKHGHDLEVGHFFGEGCLAGQWQRMATATAMAPSTILAVEKSDMVRQLHAAPAFADRFLTHMLTRNIRIEEDLVDQLFNSTEKRLARTLLLLARYGEPEASHRAIPKLSQEVLAEMVGTTRSRVNFFMNKFRKLGFIDYNGDLKINNSLLSVVLRD